MNPLLDFLLQCLAAHNCADAYHNALQSLALIVQHFGIVP